MLAACVAAAPAVADAADPEIRKLLDQAVNVDYLETNFDDAAAKLERALSLCEERKCGELAEIHADLAMVELVGRNNEDRAREQMKLALDADPNLRLDQALLSGRLAAVWEEVAGRPVPTGPSKPAKSAESPKSEGMTHVRVAEQAVRTPVPIFVTVETEGDVAVWVRYKPKGTKGFKRVKLTRMNGGFGGEIPCLDVGTVTGALSYYLEAIAKDGSVIASAGSAERPFETRIVESLSGEPPRLPGRPPSAQCADKADCPPGLPGCAPPPAERPKEEAAPDEGPQNWFLLQFQQDLLFFSSEDRVCSGGNQYYCYYDEEVYYAGLPYDRDGNEIAGGIGLGNQRLMVGYDRAFLDMFTAGARVGYSFNGSPEAPDGSQFIPVFAEATFAYHFLDRPFAREGFVPYVFISGGYAQLDSRLDVIVYDGEQAFRSDERTTLDAWRRTGSGFASAGGGTAIKITSFTGFSADIRVMQLFPTLGTAMAGRAGYFIGI